MGRRFVVIEEHLSVRCPSCGAVDVDARNAHICPRCGAQVIQHQPLLHATSRTLKRPRISHQVENRRTVHCGKELRIYIVITIRSLRDAPNRVYRDKSILLNVTHAYPHAQVHLRGGSADDDGSAALTSEARKRKHYACPGHVSFDERSQKLCHFSGGKLWAHRCRRQQLCRPASS